MEFIIIIIKNNGVIRYPVHSKNDNSVENVLVPALTVPAW